jgi:hypothetical protein
VAALKKALELNSSNNSSDIGGWFNEDPEPDVFKPFPAYPDGERPGSRSAG